MRSENSSIREDLARMRTDLANERTLMAYWRTGLAFLGLGALLIKFLEENGFLYGSISIVLGAGLMIYGINVYWHDREKIKFIVGEKAEPEAKQVAAARGWRGRTV